MDAKARNLTSNEVAILKKMLASPFAGRDEIAEQLANCRVVEIGDGEGSVKFEVDGQVKVPIDKRIPVEGRLTDVDGKIVEILLHVIDGKLSELEIVKYGGEHIVGKLDPHNMVVQVN